MAGKIRTPREEGAPHPTRCCEACGRPLYCRDIRTRMIPSTLADGTVKRYAVSTAKFSCFNHSCTQSLWAKARRQRGKRNLRKLREAGLA